MTDEINLVNIYSFITPAAVIMIVLEILYCSLLRKSYITFPDAITNLGTALGNQCVNLLVAFLVLVSFGKIYEYRLLTIETTWVNFIILLVLFDFLFYWYHRHNHTINFLWAAHMPHHTSEEFNLFVAVRASITQRLFSFTYLWPLALLGFKPEAIYAASAVQLFLAFWHHTRTIGRMKWFEMIFNSPSYHRIHHAINEKYLDKNFGEIFILWDKWFGTYAEETEEPVYGALTPVASWNPNKIYWHYWLVLWRDACATKSWWDKLRLWFMPLGWRPEDCRNIPRYRVNEKTLVKFTTPVSPATKNYLILSSILGTGLMFIAINLQWPLTVTERVVLTGLVWHMITNWGGMLESRDWARHSDGFFVLFESLVLSWLVYRFQLESFKPVLIVYFSLRLSAHALWRVGAQKAQGRTLAQD